MREFPHVDVIMSKDTVVVVRHWAEQGLPAAETRR